MDSPDSSTYPLKNYIADAAAASSATMRSISCLLVRREQIELLSQPLEGQHPLGPQPRRAENDHDRQHHRDSDTYLAFHALSLGREQAAFA